MKMKHRIVTGAIVFGWLAGAGVAPAADLVGYWALDELSAGKFPDTAPGGSLADDATLVANADLDTTVKWVGAGSAVFDGTGALLSAADSADLDVSTDRLTLMAWVRQSNRAGMRSVAGKSADGDGTYLLRIDDGFVRAGLQTSNPWVITAKDGIQLAENTWYHVAMVYDGAQILRYVNGLPTGTASAQTGNVRVNDCAFGIGSAYGAARWPFAGNIDEVRLYDRALSAHEIQAIGGLPIAGHWTLDELAGGSFPDTGGGAADDASRVNDADIDTGNKKLGAGSGIFDGTGDYLTAADSADLDIGGSNITAGAWIYGNGFPTYAGVLGKSGLGDGTYQLRLDGGRLRAGVHTTDWNISLDDGAALSVGAWHHVAMVYDGTQILRYVDGQSYGAAMAATGALRVNGSSFGIGAVDGEGQYANFNGNIDDVVLRCDALTADEVKCWYDVGNEAALGYDASQFEQLRQVHDQEVDFVDFGKLHWTRATGLGGGAGLSGGSGNYTLIMNAANDTGLRSEYMASGTMISIR